MLQLPPMPMDMFENIFKNIDEDYPFSLSPKIMLITLVVMSIFIIALGLILIWYKRKVTLSSSTVGNLVKLVPSLAGNSPSLDSLLPMLSELAQSTAYPQTTSATPQQVAVDKLTPLTPSISITGLRAKPIQLSRSTTQPHAGLTDGASNKPSKPRSTSMEDAIEPVSLEMFNKAATDLEAKGIINLRRYTKYLAKKDSKLV